MRLTLVLLAAGFAAQAQTAGMEHWVATWGTAESLLPPSATGPAGFHNQTVRMVARTSIGGQRVRIKVENAFGVAPVTIGAAHIALRSKDSAIVSGSDRAITFDGKPGCILSPGVERVSDPVELTVPALGELAVSLYFPGDTGSPTSHGTGLHTAYISKEGDVSGQAEMPDAATSLSYYYLASIDVQAPAAAAAVVTFGDSITDGTQSTPNTNHSWPALLAVRLAKNRPTGMIGVSNMGISGNRVLYDGAGASALARFDRDVLSQSGVKWVMLMEGINDIGRIGTPTPEAPTADDLIAAYRQFIDMAHTHGIKVIGCTLTPYEGAKYAREPGEAVREAVNTFIRTGGAFDSVVDFEAVTRDPADPKRFRPSFDPGDHLHPNDAGYQAMADAVDLAIFTRK
ncbi:MAG TPA: SGNH/GDSL hydrolase family protein [Bryobacteraceae bacterium]|jgi:lysophospholipase L1-like esterase|nr:SGNH/GDSL hydrolase family protein [Bryobacteraceae bacterium]